MGILSTEVASRLITVLPSFRFFGAVASFTGVYVLLSFCFAFAFEWISELTVLPTVSLCIALSKSGDLSGLILLPSPSKMIFCLLGEGLPPTPSWYAWLRFNGDA